MTTASTRQYRLGSGARALFGVALAAALALPAAAGAQSLPEASAVIARYQQAVGGKDALANYNSMHTVGEVSMPAQGLVATLETFAARPGNAATRMTIAGFGEIRSGVNGEVAWSMNPMEGPRLLQGAEKTQNTEGSSFEVSLRPASLIKSATSVERTKLGGRDCLKVRVEWQSGRTSHDCYSEETGLLVGTLSTQQTNMGALETVSLLDDYRETGGILMPMRLTVQTMGMEQIITLREVKFNSVPESAFELPAEIRALIR
jgi:hypothetical protein